jgi:hypothetical protein
VKKFLKESFSNGNKFTNILLSIVTGLLLIIGFLLRDIYSDFKDLVKTSARHETRIEVIETNLTNHINK